MKKLLFWVLVLVISISLLIVFSSIGCSRTAQTVEEPVVKEVTDKVEEALDEPEQPDETSKEETKEQDQAITIEEDSELQYLIGTWINTGYDNQDRSGMVVYMLEADGTITYSAYDNSDGSGNVYKGSVQFLSKWFDDEGIVYAQSKVTLEEGMSWDTLSRVSADGKTLEVQPDATEIDINDSRYSIYYLQ